MDWDLALILAVLPLSVALILLLAARAGDRWVALGICLGVVLAGLALLLL